MSYQKVFICRGLPASGKSTWAKEQVRRGQGKVKRINKDDLRAMLDDSKYTGKNEKFIERIRNVILGEALQKGHDVIIDDTNLNPRQIKDIETYIDVYKSSNIEVNNHYIEIIKKDFFDVSVEECIKRNALREGKARVPDFVIYNMNNKWIKNSKKTEEEK